MPFGSSLETLSTSFFISSLLVISVVILEQCRSQRISAWRLFRPRVFSLPSIGAFTGSFCRDRCCRAPSLSAGVRTKRANDRPVSLFRSRATRLDQFNKDPIIPTNFQRLLTKLSDVDFRPVGYQGLEVLSQSTLRSRTVKSLMGLQVCITCVIINPIPPAGGL